MSTHRTMRLFREKKASSGSPRIVAPGIAWSSGDQESAFGFDQALVTVRSVAVADVVGHRLGECVPVGVVGVLDHELTDRPEVTLDAIQEAGVGGGEDEFDVAGGGPLAD